MESLGKLFGSSARVKLLRLFLFNEDTAFTASEASARARTGKDATRKEIALLAATGILKKKAGKGAARYQANRSYEHYEQLLIFLRSTTSVKDGRIINTFKKTGALRAVVLTGIFTGVIEPKVDVLVVGDKLNERSVKEAIHSIEAELGRELRYASFATPDFRYRVGVYDRLVRDVMDYPHRTIFDKIGL
jgi:hypothetical protein